MTGKEYLLFLNEVEIDCKKTEPIKTLYTGDIPEIILKVVSDSNTPIFLESGTRVMSFEEIVDAEEDLHVAFPEKGLIPIADCGENDFIVYDINEKKWSKFNIVEEVVFGKRVMLDDLLK